MPYNNPLSVCLKLLNRYIEKDKTSCIHCQKAIKIIHFNSCFKAVVGKYSIGRTFCFLLESSTFNSKNIRLPSNTWRKATIKKNQMERCTPLINISLLFWASVHRRKRKKSIYFMSLSLYSRIEFTAKNNWIII